MLLYESKKMASLSKRVFIYFNSLYIYYKFLNPSFLSARSESDVAFVIALRIVFGPSLLLKNLFLIVFTNL